MLYEALCLKRMAYLMDCNNQQFLDTSRVVRVFGPMGVEWMTVHPWEIIGEHDYLPAGSSVEPIANKEVRRQQLNEVMQIILQTQNPYVDLYELTKMWLESYDIRNVEKLLRKPEAGAQFPLPAPASLPKPAEAGPEQVAQVEKVLGGFAGIREGG
jgi:hypothetical protein